MREHAERLNRGLQLESLPGHGTHVVHRRPIGMSEKIRVLVAEDNLIAGVAGIINKQPDMTVVGETLDGRRAVELFRRCLPCVTLLDIRMPRRSGIEAAVAIRAEYPEARLIVLTSYDGEEGIRRAFESGVVGFLTKDVLHDELIKAIRAVKAGSTYLPPKLAAMLATPLERPHLSPRELEVLDLIVRGLSNKQIAYDLRISEETAKNHVKHIFQKLDVRNRTQAATIAFRRGIIQL